MARRGHHYARRLRAHKVIFVPNVGPPALSEQIRWRRGLGAGYILLGVFWIIDGIVGTTNISYEDVGIGLGWILGGAAWFWGVARLQHRAERSSAEKG